MIALTPQMKVMLYSESVDFRNGIDGMAGLCRQHFAEDPFSGVVFVFRNRRATAVKLLVYDGQGFWLCQKRLSEGRFMYWPKGTGASKRQLLAHQLSVLLMAGDPDSTRAASNWRPLQNAG